MTPIVVPSGEGEVVGDAPDRRVEILSDHDALHATWSRFGPYREGADLHVHYRHTDLFYVLDGELTLRLGAGDEPVVAPAGTLVRVPPLVVHGFRNGSAEQVRYLNFHAPGEGFAGFLRGLRDRQPVDFDQHDPPADGGRPTSEAELTEGSGVLADVEAIRVELVTREPGQPAEASANGLASLYVVAGSLTIAAGERELAVEAGAWAQLPPGTPYRVEATGGAPARWLDVRTPT